MLAEYYYDRPTRGFPKERMKKREEEDKFANIIQDIMSKHVECYRETFC